MATKPKGPVSLVVDNLGRLNDDLLALSYLEALVGFPETTTERDADYENPNPPTNAALGYIHDTGMPEQNIPARPFMLPGIESVEGRLTDLLANGARAVLSRGQRGFPRDEVLKLFHQVGIVASTAIKKKINEGVPPPLSERTLRQRANRGGKSKGRKGAIAELDNRSQGLPPSTSLAKPLVDTAEMRNAVTYVVRNRRARKA